MISRETAEKLQRTTAEFKQADEHLTQVREATTSTTFVPEAAEAYLTARREQQEVIAAAEAEVTAG